MIVFAKRMDVTQEYQNAMVANALNALDVVDLHAPGSRNDSSRQAAAIKEGHLHPF